MTPSGVQKERIKPEELFVVNKAGEVVCAPETKPGCGKAKLSDCAPLFLHAYNQRNAGAVLHSHGVSCNIITMLFSGKSEFRITQQEMIKGIDGHGYYDELVIPIIENTAWEHELADSLGQAIAKYPKACAVLVRQHGMYVWGNTWEQAKRHGECLHYLFDAAIQIEKLGLTHMISAPALSKDTLHAKLNYKHLLLDIEGTLSPISFVKDVLFPFSEENFKQFLSSKWESEEMKAIVADLHAAAKEEQLSCSNLDEAVEFLKHCVKADRKLTPLKQLQGLIWKEGYEKGIIVSQVFDDVPPSLERLTGAGVKVSIYSSGSRQAQHLLFQYSNHGNLKKFLNAYFDTKVGAKIEKASYSDIVLTLGANANEILFVTDVLAEAKAASAAGLNVAIASRPGNAEILESHEFPVVSSFNLL